MRRLVFRHPASSSKPPPTFQSALHTPPLTPPLIAYVAHDDNYAVVVMREEDEGRESITKYCTILLSYCSENNGGGPGLIDVYHAHSHLMES